MQKKTELVLGLLMAVGMAMGCSGVVDESAGTSDSQDDIVTTSQEARTTGRRKPPASIPAGTVCAVADEGNRLSLSCPSGQTITAVTFVSYGTPSGSCGAFRTGTCNAADAATTLAGLCVGQNACEVDATNDIFGDPCEG